MKNENSIIFINKIEHYTKEDPCETWNRIKQLRKEQLNSTDKTTYNLLGKDIETCFNFLLERINVQKKYFIKGTPEERNIILHENKILSTECIIVSSLKENKINIFNKLAGMRGNIIWVTEQTAELWSFKQLINYLC